MLKGIFGRAGGGAVRGGTPVWTGETGRRELFVPESDGRIFPESALGSGPSEGAQIQIDARGAQGNAEVEAAIQRGVAAALAAYDKGLRAKILFNARDGMARSAI